MFLLCCPVLCLMFVLSSLQFSVVASAFMFENCNSFRLIFVCRPFPLPTANSTVLNTKDVNAVPCLLFLLAMYKCYLPQQFLMPDAIPVTYYPVQSCHWTIIFILKIKCNAFFLIKVNCLSSFFHIITPFAY